MLVKFVIFLRLDFALILSPKRNHRIKRFCAYFCNVFTLFVRVGNLMAHFHNDRVANVVGILLYKLINCILLKVFWVVLVFRVLFNVKSNFTSCVFLFTFFDCISVSTRWNPLVSDVLAECFWNNLYLISNHKWRIEAYAELTDNRNIVCLFIVCIFFFEIEWAALCDCAEIVFKLFSGHTDAVIADFNSSVFLVKVNMDFEIFSCKLNAVICKRFEI